METVCNNLDLEEAFPFFVYRFCYESGEKMEQFHFHNYLELSLIEKGTFLYEFEEGPVICRGGDLVVINHVEPHRIEALETGTTVTVIGFRPELVWNGTSKEDYRYLEGFFGETECYQNLVTGQKRQEEMGRWMIGIREEAERKEDGYRLLMKANLLSLLAQLYRDQPRKPASLRRKQQSQIGSVGEWMAAHLKEGITLEACAAHLGYSPTYFSRKFRDAYGMRFCEYWNRIRIGKCLSLLAETDLPVREIALRCGFRNQANFRKIFLQRTGTTPGKFRRRRDAEKRAFLE